jgi:DNA-binding beta-propeller fold protein YncE
MVFYGSNLYVANQSGNNVISIDTSGNQTVKTTITNPIGITTDGDDFFVTGSVLGVPAIYPFPVGGAVLGAAIAACTNCYGLAATPTTWSGGGPVYSVDQSNNRVKVSTSAGTRANLTVADKPTGLAFYNNSVFVTRHDANNTVAISRVAANDTVTDFVTDTNAMFNQPNGIAINAANGDMYVVNEGTAGASSVLKITSAGVVTQFLSTANGLCSATGVAINGSALYVSNGFCASGATAAQRNFILKASPI